MGRTIVLTIRGEGAKQRTTNIRRRC